MRRFPSFLFSAFCAVLRVFFLVRKCERAKVRMQIAKTGPDQDFGFLSGVFRFATRDFHFALFQMKMRVRIHSIVLFLLTNSRYPRNGCHFSNVTMSLLNDADKVSLYNSEPVKWRTPKIRLPTEKNVAFFASENRNCSGLHNVIYFPLAILHTPQRTRMKSSKFGGSCSSRWNIRVANRESAPGLYFGFREGKQGSA